ncbi:DNA gyrase inhibitor YacG [Sphingomicrobium sp. XHP0235]|uniref:DNA gyrase inhibitor YacG n=1 Tax=Sphingomicrobium aquimarinum TaxID=3133971 RepID=UPI0031FF110C
MPAKPSTCPVCKKTTDPEHRPFCSRGCKDRDLLAWLGDGYRIPGPSIVEEGLDSPPEDS